MNNSDIFRRLRFAFNFSDTQMVNLFALGGEEVSKEQILIWLSKEDNPIHKGIYDKHLATFLNGFIIDRRGKREGPPPKPEKNLNNNIIFRKLKIALSLKDVDILSILELADMRISKHELSAFFRNPKQSQYRLCKDQILRNFIYGLQARYRGA